MKKITILLCAAMLIAMTACGSGGTTSRDRDRDSDNAASEKAGTSQQETAAGYQDVADEVADAFAGIETDITWDTGDLENWDEQNQQTYPDSVNGVSTMDDIADIYRFTLDGKAYALPCGLKELLNDGWETRLTDTSTETLDGRTYSVYVLYKADASVSVSVANFSDTSVTVEQGTVIEITASSEGKADFQTGKGLELGDTSQRVTDLYGSETDVSSDTGVEYRYLRQLGFQQNISGIMSEYTLDDCFKIQWDASGKITCISMKFLNE